MKGCIPFPNAAQSDHDGLNHDFTSESNSQFISDVFDDFLTSKLRKFAPDIFEKVCDIFHALCDSFMVGKMTYDTGISYAEAASDPTIAAAVIFLCKGLLIDIEEEADTIIFHR